MIYGIVPVGGKGTRLGLPFPKELLPLKGHDFYYPVCKFTIDNMIAAGCDKIYLIHGAETKELLKNYFNDEVYEHINNHSPLFSKTITCFEESVDIKEGDKILYGLPDSHYDGNPFIDLCSEPGLSCGLFRTVDDSRVDRILKKENKFDVKNVKTEDNLNLFWGVLKFDRDTILKYCEIQRQTGEPEVGNIVNQIPFTTVEAGDYIDLGTWSSLNIYWERK